MHSKGRKGIDEGHAGIFAVIYKVSHNKATIRSVRFIRPDVAIAHVEWNLEFETGGQSHKAHAMNTIVASREQGKWQINAVHNTPIQAAR